MDNYFVHIPGVPQSLTKEETQKCIILMNKGNQEARQLLIEGNLKLVLHLINTRFQHLPFDKEELFQIGCIGLIKGIDTYDSNKNIELATYVSRCIINEILMVARKGLTLPLEESIDEPIKINDNEHPDKTLLDVLECKSNLVSDYERKEAEFIAKEIIKELPDDYRLLIEMYFGINGQKRHNQRELSAFFNCSQANISRTINKLLIEIRNEMESVNVYRLSHRNQPNSSIKK